MALVFRSFKGAELILESDGAIESGHIAYVQAYFDRSKLTMRAGQEPTVFRVEALTGEMLDTLEQLAPGRVRNRIALRYALRETRNLVLDDGKTKRDAPPIKRSQVGERMMVDEAWFDEVRLPTNVLAELAEYVYRVSSPDPTSPLP